MMQRLLAFCLSCCLGLALLAAAAERAPVLVLIDDLQWADRSSREAILFAARRLDADAVAVVVALRDDGAIAEGELAGFELLRVGGLTLEEMAQVLDISVATVERDWRAARAWLYAALNSERPR